MARSIGIELPGLARMAEVTRAISEAASHGPAPAPAPMRILTTWVVPATASSPSLTLTNRAVMAPMSTGTADAEGLPSIDTRAWYAARARGGVGLIIVEPTFVAPVPFFGDGRPLVCSTEAYVARFATLADEIRVGGSIPAISLDHPDDRPLDTWSHHELHDAVEAFRVASIAVKAAGYAAVHLSLDASSWLGRSVVRSSNRRTDRYGRGPTGRLRLTRSVLVAVASAGLPVIVRVPCPATLAGSTAIDLTVSLAAAVVECGASVIEIAPGPRFDDKRLPLLAGSGEAVLSVQAGAVVARLVEIGVTVPIITNGRIASPSGAEAALAVPGVEAVAIGRALIADAAWLAKVRAGVEAEIVPCIGCLACFDHRSGGAVAASRIGCVTNGDAGHEADPLEGTNSPRRITVLGSGLPGLEFARVAVSRGHEVTVVPDANPLGGITGLRSGVPGNAEFGRAALGAFDRLRELGVTVQGTASPDAGLTVDGRPSTPWPVTWGSGRNVLRAGEVLGRDLHQMYGIGRRVAVCGPGALAAEVALFLAGWGRRPTVIVPGGHDAPFPDVHPMHAARLQERLTGYKCELVTGAVPVAWRDARDRKSRLVVRRGTDEVDLGPFQTAVDCAGWPMPTADGAEGIVLGDAAIASELRRLVRAANVAARTI